MNENFYDAIYLTYDKVFEILKKNIELYNKYEKDLINIINKTSEGYGLGDYLEEELDDLKIS